MAKMTKKFFVTITGRKYDGSVHYTPKCYKRFSTMEEAEAYAARLNVEHSKEKQDEMYRVWVADPETPWATEEWYKRHKEKEAFYWTYEAKETK